MSGEAVTRREGSALESSSLAGARIVVMDDDPIVECRSTDETLGEFANRRPDVLVSDIEMPGQDGYSLNRKLRALGPEQGGKTPAVALTAFGRPEDRIRSLRAGFNIHLIKPVDSVELIASIASMIGRAG